MLRPHRRTAGQRPVASRSLLYPTPGPAAFTNIYGTKEGGPLTVFKRGTKYINKGLCHMEDKI